MALGPGLTPIFSLILLFATTLISPFFPWQQHLGFDLQERKRGRNPKAQ
jgi:hypothetical protein